MVIHSTDLIRRFKKFKRDLERAEKERNSALVLRILNSFWNFINRVNHVQFKKLETDVEYKKLKKFFGKRWRNYIAELEKIESRAFLEKKLNPSRKSVLSQEDYSGINCELKLLPIKSLNNKTFVMVGCGPYPETLINTYLSNPGLKKVIGIDASESSSRIAKKIIKKIFNPDSEQNVQILNQRGEKYNFFSADIIFLANGLEKKKKILETIIRTAASNKKYILVRNPESIGRILYEDIFDHSFSKKMKLLRQINPTKLSKTLLFILK